MLGFAQHFYKPVILFIKKVLPMLLSKNAHFPTVDIALTSVTLPIITTLEKANVRKIKQSKN